MVFNSTEVIIIFFFSAWLLVISVLLFRMIRHYNILTAGAQRSGIREILERILETQRGLQQDTKELYALSDAIKKEGLLHVQRIGLVRFNPFSDTGGSQSFTLALLDGNDNGLVMTSLYARTGHRWYIKEVVGNKGKELALSKEEQAAIQKARPLVGKHI